MSRGLGKVERSTLELLESWSGSATLESVRWKLFERSSRANDATGDLPMKWDSAVRRSVSSLKKKGYLDVKKERLASLQECVEHFPNKTFKATLRTLRLKLLPVIAQWDAEGPGVPKHYSESENEEYFVRKIEEVDKLSFEHHWHGIEPQLRTLFARTGAQELLLLVGKARQLLGFPGAEVQYSLTTLASQCCELECVSKALARRLHACADIFFPQSVSGQLKLKSLIYGLCDVPGKGTAGRCKLRGRTLRELHRRSRDFIEQMDGYRPRRSPYPEPTFDPEIHSLFDVKVFEEFHFLSMR